jgi:hypothetical protein
MVVKFVDSNSHIPQYSQQVNVLKLTPQNLNLLTPQNTKLFSYFGHSLNININSFYTYVYNSRRVLLFNKSLYMGTVFKLPSKSLENSVLHLI